MRPTSTFPIPTASRRAHHRALRRALAPCALAALGVLLLRAPAPCQTWETLLAANSPQCAVYLDHGARTRAPVSAEAVRCRFAAFAGQWLGKIGRSLRHTEGNMELAPDKEGWVARFVRLDQDSASFQVNPSASSGCPWVGVLRYEEHHFEGRGPSASLAAEGPFEHVRSLRVTEIFRFVSGRWTE